MLSTMRSYRFGFLCHFPLLSTEFCCFITTRPCFILLLISLALLPSLSNATSKYFKSVLFFIECPFTVMSTTSVPTTVCSVKWKLIWRYINYFTFVFPSLTIILYIRFHKFHLRSLYIFCLNLHLNYSL